MVVWLSSWPHPPAAACHGWGRLRELLRVDRHDLARHRTLELENQLVDIDGVFARLLAGEIHVRFHCVADAVAPPQPGEYGGAGGVLDTLPAVDHDVVGCVDVDVVVGVPEDDERNAVPINATPDGAVLRTGAGLVEGLDPFTAVVLHVGGQGGRCHAGLAAQVELLQTQERAAEQRRSGLGVRGRGAAGETDEGEEQERELAHGLLPSLGLGEFNRLSCAKHLTTYGRVASRAIASTGKMAKLANSSIKTTPSSTSKYTTKPVVCQYNSWPAIQWPAKTKIPPLVREIFRLFLHKSTHLPFPQLVVEPARFFEQICKPPHFISGYF